MEYQKSSNTYIYYTVKLFCNPEPDWFDEVYFDTDNVRHNIRNGRWEAYVPGVTLLYNRKGILRISIEWYWTPLHEIEIERLQKRIERNKEPRAIVYY